MTSTRPIAAPPALRAESASRRVDSDSGPPGSSFDLILERTAQARTAPAEGQTEQTETTKESVTNEQQAQTGSDAANDQVPTADSSVPVDQTLAAVDAAALAAATGEGSDPAITVVASAPSLGSSSIHGQAVSAAGPSVLLEDGTGTAVGVEAPAAGLSKSEVTAPVLEGAGAVAGLISEDEARPAGVPSPLAASTPGAATKGEQPAAATTTAQPTAAQVAPAQVDPEPSVVPPAPPVLTEDPMAAQATATVRMGGTSAPTAAYSANPAARIQHIQALVDLAISRGSASATLELYPAELGDVTVRLRSGRGGLSASMTVDRPEALAALQASADDLRRSLEAKGIEVIRLEIGLSAQSREDQARTGARSDGQGPSNGERRASGSEATSDPLDHRLATLAPVPLNPGALVDVHA